MEARTRLLLAKKLILLELRDADSGTTQNKGTKGEKGEAKIPWGWNHGVVGQSALLK